MSLQRYLLMGILFSLLFTTSCGPEEQAIEDFDLSIRLRNDPGRINPMVGNSTIESTEVNSLVFLPLAHYDPISYEMSPVLVRELPAGRKITEGNFAGGIAYDYEILPDASWDDGTPITGEDYLFTVKVAKNPNVDAVSWRGLINDIVEVKVDPENKKKFTVVIGEYFHLARESSCTFEIFPRHIYDSKGVMDDYELDLLNNNEELAQLLKVDTTLSAFARVFSSPEYTRKTISGSGPYVVKSWEVDQYILLEKKDKYWGNAYPDRTMLHNNPQTITFRTIADDNAAITLLKDGSLDLLNVADATSFQNLKNSSNFDSLFTLSTSSLSRFYYIGLNNRVPEFEDKDVRRALAHLLDVDNIIETLESGYANRVVGTIMSNSPYVDKSLKPIPYDPKKAIEILEDEGWRDTNGNGIRDKLINGNLVEMEIDFLASQSPLGQKIGLLLQDNAKEAGIKVNMVIREAEKMHEAIYSHDFEASASATGLSLARYDPYQRWHSDNAVVGRGNVFGYVNQKNDDLIEQIRDIEDESERRKAYIEFQRLMYDEQPVIYLYSPIQKFVLNKKYKGLFSDKRPGYFAGSFTLAED